MRIQEVFKDVGSMLVIDTKKFSKVLPRVETIHNESDTVGLSKAAVKGLCAQATKDEGRLANLNKLEADNLNKLDSASNPRTSVDILSLLALDKFIRVRARVAANPSTSIKTLKELATDPTFDVLLRVAGNTNTPANVLSALAQHKNSEVRMRVARNSNASQLTLSELLLDEDFRVRSSVSTNVNKQSQEVKHYTHAQVSVIQDCKQTVDFSKRVADRLANLAIDNDPIVRGAVAHNPDTPLKILVLLSTDNCSLVRRNVAGNSHADKNLLKTLALDHDDTVRSAVAANASTSEKILSKLILDDIRAVRVSVMINISATDEIKNLATLMELKCAVENGKPDNRSLQLHTVRGYQHFKQLGNHVVGYVKSGSVNFSSMVKSLSMASSHTQIRHSMLSLYRSMFGRLKTLPNLRALPFMRNKKK